MSVKLKVLVLLFEIHLFKIKKCGKVYWEKINDKVIIISPILLVAANETGLIFHDFIIFWDPINLSAFPFLNQLNN